MAKRKYKPMALDTSIRNPERLFPILETIRHFEGEILNDDILLDIVATLYKEKIVTSNEIDVNKLDWSELKKKVIIVNSTRKADGGFPAGYPSRFWTYMRTLSELGFVYVRYEKEFKISKLAKLYLDNKLDLQEVFSIASMMYNRKSPYRKVLNDFNYFKFIINVLFELKKFNLKLSPYEFILSLFSKNGDVEVFLKTINNLKFKNDEDFYIFLKNNYENVPSLQTILRDYPDVVKRFLIISGFISINKGGYITLNENNIELIQEMLNVRLCMSDQIKEDPYKYFEFFENNYIKFLEIVYKYRDKDVVDEINYTKLLKNIINDFEINFDKLKKELLNLGKKRKQYVIQEFKDIPEPLKLEFFIALYLVLKHDHLYVKPNYKIDHIGIPYSFAPGNKGDIEVYSENLIWLVEVSLIKNKSQQYNYETTTLIRHLNDINIDTKFLSFVAPYVHKDTKEFFDISLIKSILDKKNVFMKAYSIDDFLKIDDFFKDMRDYKKYLIREIKNKICTDI